MRDWKRAMEESYSQRAQELAALVQAEVAKRGLDEAEVGALVCGENESRPMRTAWGAKVQTARFWDSYVRLYGRARAIEIGLGLNGLSTPAQSD